MRRANLENPEHSLPSTISLVLSQRDAIMPPLTLFLNEDVTKLLHNKFVVILGDSIQRGVYKDLVALLQGNEYLSSKDLKAKGEKSFMNDVLLQGGKMHNGINYREVRQYKTDYHLVRFYFITRIHNKYWEEIIIPDLQGEPVPDVVIMNSCLWDVSRYGRHQNQPMMAFKKNIETTFSKLNSILPPETLIMWNTALPVAEEIKGGFLLPELQDLSKTMRYDVLLGNFYAKELAKYYEIDVLDLNYFFRHQMHRQVGDGVHWNYMAHRRITNLILAHIAVSWGVGCPRGRVPLKVSESLYFDFETAEEKERSLQNRSKWDDLETESRTEERESYSGKDQPAARIVRLEDRKDEKLSRPSDADSMKNLLTDNMKGFKNQSRVDGSCDPVANVRKEHEGRRSRSPLEGDRPPSRSRSPLERDRPPSRSDVRVDPVKRRREDRSPTRQDTPPLRGGGLPSSLELKPIDLGNIPRDPPLPRSPCRPLRSLMPKAGDRYQPYQPYAFQNNPPHRFQPQVRQQSWFSNQPVAPRPYYPQPQYQPYANPRPFPHYLQNTGNLYNPYMQNIAYDNRMRQRLAAERNMEVVRGLLMEGVYGLQ